jgi:hypothetical protein
MIPTTQVLQIVGHKGDVAEQIARRDEQPHPR